MHQTHSPGRETRARAGTATHGQTATRGPVSGRTLAHRRSNARSKKRRDAPQAQTHGARPPAGGHQRTTEGNTERSHAAAAPPRRRRDRLIIIFNGT